MNMVALIPARAGSKRIPGKNTRLLAGEPLLVHTIRAAQASGAFDAIYCCTDDVNMNGTCAANIAARLDVGTIMRPPADDAEPDLVWVRQALSLLDNRYNSFAILRPTSPFRTAETIRRAYHQFRHDEAHSLRAVQPVKETPYKMWLWTGAGYPMLPLLPTLTGSPAHSMPTQTLPTVYIQNASLEMAWTYVVTSFGTISGNKVAPFFTEGYEGFDLNTEDDWQQAERLLAEGKVALPALARV